MKSFKVISSFPAIKERVDQTNGREIRGIYQLIGNYQLDGDAAYLFGRERQYACFQALFQADQWSKADVLFVDWLPPFSLLVKCSVQE